MLEELKRGKVRDDAMFNMVIRVMGRIHEVAIRNKLSMAADAAARGNRKQEGIWLQTAKESLQRIVTKGQIDPEIARDLATEAGAIFERNSQ